MGVGSTGAHVKRGMTITRDQSQQLLANDLRRFEKAVNQHGGTMTQSQFDAMVSLAFNIGSEAFRKSTLLKKHLAGDFEGAAAQFSRWNKAVGKVLAGLVKRRAAEAALYLS
ncbi:lysozyme [Sphingobium sp. H39-3-25]|nr:lysozyme [Sphingobium arseniciresistens]